jgi:hypothetical protein
MNLRRALRPHNLWIDLKSTTASVFFALCCLLCVLAVESVVKLVFSGFINWIF